MKELAAYTSQNGRYGVAVTSTNEGVELYRGSAQLEAALESVGTVSGHKVYRADPGPVGQWVLLLNDAEALVGAEVVAKEDLQGGEAVTLLVLGSVAVVREYGYKKRSSRVILYKNGVEINAPISVLLALGVIEPDEKPVQVPVPQPIKEGQVAKALREAGIL